MTRALDFLAVCLSLAACRDAGARSSAVMRASAAVASAAQVPPTPVEVTTPALRPLTPSAGIVTTSRVLFRWSPAVGARVELSHDPRFERIVRDEVGERGERRIDHLTRGAWFWRVAAPDGGVSVGRRLRVSARSSHPSRQSFAIDSDINGDGLDDVPLIQTVALGNRASPMPLVHLVNGTVPGCQLYQDARTPPPRCSPQHYPRAVGDINGDGATDLVAFERLFFGGAAVGERWEAASRICQRGKDCGTVFTALGDLDADGYADVVDEGGRVYLGGPRGVTTRLKRTLPAALDADTPGFTNAGRLAGGGDFDGDGHHDVAVLSADEGLVLYPGAVDGIAFARATSIALPLPAEAAHESLRIGDLDGDGFVDVVGIASLEESVKRPGAKPDVWRRPILWVVLGRASMASMAVSVQQPWPVPDLEPSEYLGSFFSFDIDHRVAADGTAVVRAVDVGLLHYEVRTALLQGSQLRILPVKRLRGGRASASANRDWRCQWRWRRRHRHAWQRRSPR